MASQTLIRTLRHGLSRLSGAVTKESFASAQVQAKRCLSAGLTNGTSVTVCTESFMGRPTLKVDWGNGGKGHFPFVFIRDNCLCSTCYDHSAKQRVFNSVKAVSGVPKDLANIVPQSVSYEAGTEKVTIEWQDGHQSVFDLTWFKERKFPESKEEQLENSRSFRPRKIPWEPGFTCPEFDYLSIIEDDLACHNWLMSLSTHGLTLIKNAPLEPNTLTTFAKKLGGFIRKTHYGIMALEESDTAI